MEETHIDEEYLKGYNNGYLMAKDEPELAELLSRMEISSPQIDGFKAGRKEFFKELIKEKSQEWVKDFSSHDRDITPDKGIEPEI